MVCDSQSQPSVKKVKPKALLLLLLRNSPQKLSHHPLSKFGFHGETLNFNQMSLLSILICLLSFGFPGFSSSSSLVTTTQSTHHHHDHYPRRKLADSAAPCPLNFNILRKLIENADLSNRINVSCSYLLQGLRPVQSDYLKRTGFFLPPLNTSESCWNSFQSLVDDYSPNFDVRSVCGYQTNWMSEGCMNITSSSQFDTKVPESSLEDMRKSCNRPLENNSPCALCTTSLSRLQASYLNGDQIGNVTECSVYPFIYAAALVNQFGPFDYGTMKCLFSFDLPPKKSRNGKKKVVLITCIVCLFGLFGGGGGGWFLWRRRKRKQMVSKKRRRKRVVRLNSDSVYGLDSIKASTNLIRFTIEEIKQATKNFSRHNIIGKGGYGNVYKGVLQDGTEVALKRFKNCSVAGEESFTHEVEVIASVRHVNLVALRGYCTASTPHEGYQRIIVCDLMNKGSLYDHLFGSNEKKLSWPLRRKIALGTARGLAYLHYGAQPSIIHRDIKASNILLDEDFEAKVADFGLAKFTPEGITHVSTRVAGTLGYVAPEYALYGQLTERSDVYSFGVLLLEILSGKKALISTNENPNSLVTDWAWALVKEGRSLEVIEEGMTELDSPEVMEKYVLLAVLSSHPQLYARPTMDHIVKILESDIPVPSIPERPIPITSEINDIEQSGSSFSSSIPSCYQQYISETDNTVTSDSTSKENYYSPSQK